MIKYQPAKLVHNKWYRQFTCQKGDVFPEFTKVNASDSGGGWIRTSHDVAHGGHETTMFLRVPCDPPRYHVNGVEYIPPKGYRVVQDHETTKEGDAFTHNYQGELLDTPRKLVQPNVSCWDERRWMRDGYIIRECKYEPKLLDIHNLGGIFIIAEEMNDAGYVLIAISGAGYDGHVYKTRYESLEKLCVYNNISDKTYLGNLKDRLDT